MDHYTGSCPMTQQELINQYFMDHRTKLLDIAAFLDRMDRSVERNAGEDFRLVAFRRALEVLTSSSPARVEKIQMLLSDPNVELLDERDQQSAFGASRRSTTD
jgi:hypothetical protein